MSDYFGQHANRLRNEAAWLNPPDEGEGHYIVCENCDREIAECEDDCCDEHDSHGADGRLCQKCEDWNDA